MTTALLLTLAAVTAHPTPPATPHSAPDSAGLRLASVLTDHMVVQREQPVTLWGWAAPGSHVTATADGRSASATADEHGRWSLELDPLPAGGPYAITVAAGDRTETLDDVLSGDVWLASGQSNMEWPLQNTDRGAESIAAADIPGLRLLTVGRAQPAEPAPDITTRGWAVSAPGSASGFSAVGFHFGRLLHEELGVPIGVINASWGGSPVESWMPERALREAGRYSAILGRMEAYNAAAANAAAGAQAAQQNWAAFIGELYASGADLGEGYEAAGLDDGAWPEIPVPGRWETTVAPDLDGIVWFRRTIDLPAAWEGKPARLALGAIDDFDQTFVNGVAVGGTDPSVPNAYQRRREYDVPPGVLRAGKNVVAVRVIDVSGGGGFSGSGEDLRLTGDGLEPVALDGRWRYAVAADAEAEGWPSPPWILPGSLDPMYRPVAMYNGMIAPITPLPIRGVIWYQGETNTGRSEQYRHLFPLFIESWREAFGNPDLPVLFVQLANYMQRAEQPGESGWAELRDAQAAALALPKTGMATAVDLGEADDIHPRNKLDVARRLAANALAIEYGRDVPHRGPTPAEIAFEGREARVRFEHAAGLTTGDGRPPQGFALAERGKPFRRAEARIEGDTVVLTAEGVEHPAEIRYAWADNPDVNLYNEHGFPATPFRTDERPMVTAGRE